MRWQSSGDIFWIEAELPGARAAFSSRSGGVSEGPFESLNVGDSSGDERGAVAENRHRLAAALGLQTQSVAIGRQVHGVELATHATTPGDAPFGAPGAAAPEVDGHVVVRPGPAALVFVADCLPVALAGPRGAAVLHCGWRGLAAGIVARGVEAVGATHAAIGPGIGPCCYEVGAEVLDAFGRLGPGVAAGRRLNLVEVAERLLREAGVEHIDATDICTSCEVGYFFSHRRDSGLTGRQAGLAWLDGEAA